MSKHSLRLGGGKWAVKEDKILAYAEGDISGKFRAHEMDFDRGDDIDATRVNKEGLIEKARENRFQYSNSFRSTYHWGHNGLHAYYGPENNPDGVPDDEQGYDGSGDVSFIVCSSTDDAVHRFQSTLPSGTAVQTFSIYAKALGYKWLAITTNNGSMEAYFDLENGEIGTVESDVIEAKMIDAGNGWYRCSIAVNDDLAVTTIGFGIADGDENHVFDGNKDQGGSLRGGIYVMDAQWERGSVLTPYIHSADTTTGKTGHSEDMPRIDYMNGKAQLLLEADRTNYFTCSEYAGGNTLTEDPVLTENYAISPEGRKNAFKIADNVAGEYRRVSASVTKEIDEDLDWTFSVFVKKAASPVSSYGGIALTFGGGTPHQAYVAFDDHYGTLVHVTGSATRTNDNRLTLHKAKSYGDYWRFAISVRDTDQSNPPVSNDNTSVNAILYARLSDSGTALGTTESKEYVAYGMQFEKGLFPTSYIPTYGASATRSRDHITDITSASEDGILGNYNTTMFFDGVAYRNQGNGRFIAISNTSGSSSDPRVLLFTAGHSNNKFRVYAQYLPDNDLDNDVLIYQPTDRMVSVGEEFKALLRVNGTSFSLFANGFKEGTDTFTKQNDIERLDFVSSLGDLGHSINDAQIFPFSLTDNDAFVLTSNETYATFADMSETLKYSS